MIATRTYVHRTVEVAYPAYYDVLDAAKLAGIYAGSCCAFRPGYAGGFGSLSLGQWVDDEPSENELTAAMAKVIGDVPFRLDRPTSHN